MAYKPVTAEGLRGRTLFRERMRRDGRLEALNARERELRAGGDSRSIPLSMREFGYKGLDEEVRLERERLKKGESVRGSELVLGLQDALSRIPAQTPSGVSIFAWVAAHPAMKRFDPSGNTRVEIGADDVLNSPHGKAPSREAVAALERFANQPADFWKKWLEVQAKTEMKVVGESAEDEDVGVVDVERMLKQVRSRRKDNGKK